MKQCTYCGKKYPDDAVVCVIDQMELKSDQPEPEPVADSANNLPTEPAQAEEVPEGYKTLGNFEPFDASRLLRQLEQDGIRFLIDQIEQPVVVVQGIRKRALILIYVHQDDEERATRVLTADWKV